MQFRETIFLIDDDLIQLKVAGKMIEQVIGSRKIKTFLEAESALDFIKNHLEKPVFLPDTILLDLNMPEMNGWDFLEVFEEIKPLITKEIKVYILTSSQDDADMEKSTGYPSVFGYIVKPLTREKITKLFPAS